MDVWTAGPKFVRAEKRTIMGKCGPSRKNSSKTNQKFGLVSFGSKFRTADRITLFWTRITDHRLDQTKSDQNIGSPIQLFNPVRSSMPWSWSSKFFRISLSITGQGQTIRWRSFKESLIYLFVLWSPGFALVFLSSYLALFLCRFGAKFNEQTKQRLITTV